MADTGNNRILRYAKPLLQASGGYILPNMVIGQKSVTGSTANSPSVSASTLSLAGTGLRTGLTFDSKGNLWVSDTGNNRVLRFPASVLSAGASAPSADIVIGQKDFTTNTSLLATLISVSTLAGPSGLSFDPAGASSDLRRAAASFGLSCCRH